MLNEIIASNEVNGKLFSEDRGWVVVAIFKLRLVHRIGGSEIQFVSTFRNLSVSYLYGSDTMFKSNV